MDALTQTVEVVSNELVAEWSDLAERLEASPFLYPGWIVAWASAFHGEPLSLLTLRRAGRLAGLVPFTERATVTSSPTNWHTPEFGLLAEDARARGELAAALIDQPRHRLDIGFLDGDGEDMEVLSTAAAAAGHRVRIQPMQSSPYVEIDGSWDEYAKRVGSKRLRELRRRRRKLSELGDVTVDFVRPSEDELPPLLADGFAVEGSGWKSERGTAILSEPHLTSFYTDVARWAARHGWLTLAFLRVDGRPAAFDLCIEAAGRTYVLKGGYDPALHSFAPRTILLQESLQRAFADGMRSYEFLGADDDYKLPWSTGVRDYRRLQAFPVTATGIAGYFAWQFGRPAAKRALELRERIGAKAA